MASQVVRLVLSTALTLLAPGVALAAVGRWTGGGPWWGTVRAFAVDPANPSRVFAAAENRIFVTTNGGARWEATPNHPPRLVLSLAIDPTAPGTLYAGTAYEGVFKTTDSGTNWFPAGYLRTVNRLAVDPRSSDTVWAATDEGIFKSVDGGASWTRTAPQSSGGRALTLDPANPDVIYVGSDGHGGAVYKSTNGGETWFVLSVPTAYEIWSIGVDPMDSARVFAGTGGSGFFRSTDGGTTWVESSLPAPATAVHDIQFHGSAIYVETTDVLESTDAGLHWRNLGPSRDEGYYPFSFLVDPNGALYVGRQDGVLKSTDDGETWNARSVGLSATQILSLALDPLDPDRIYGGSSGEPSMFKSSDLGRHWTAGARIEPLGGVYAIAVDPAEPGVVYAGGSAGLWKTTDFGSRWTWIVPATSTLDFLYVTSLAIHPREPRTLLMGFTCCDSRFPRSGIYQSLDGGVSWQWLEGGLPDSVFRALDYAPDGNLVFAGADAGLFRSLDGGLSWSATPLTAKIRAVKVDPRDTSAVYAASFGEGVFRSDDGGLTWVSASQGLTNPGVRALALDPLRPESLYAGTDDGVFESLDRGESWTPISAGLGDRQVLSLVLDSRRTLHAGTTSRGAFEYTIPEERRLTPAEPHRSSARVLDPRP